MANAINGIDNHEDAPAQVVRGSGPELLKRYGDLLDDDEMSEIAKQELLLVLFQIMQGFVDLGFRIAPGDKFSDSTALGMDDVLRYLTPDDTAHETVAPETPPTNEEQ